MRTAPPGRAQLSGAGEPGRQDSPAKATWTYAMATPDAVVGGALPVILERLAAFGLAPVACRLIGLDIGRMKRFYETASFLIHDPGREDYTFSWSMHRALYDLAPAYVLMLTSEDGAADRQVLRCKGSTRPEIASPDSVRSLGENVIFNLLHCPDDAPSAAAELGILLGEEAAGWMVSIASAPRPTRPDDQDDPLSAGAAADCLPAFSGTEAISFVSIGNVIRCRAVQLLSLALHLDPAGVSLLRRASRLPRDERKLLREHTRTADRLRLAMRASPAIQEAVTAAVARADISGLSAGLGALAELYDLRGSRDLRAIFALTSSGIYLAPLEKVIIESHCHAFRPNNEINHIYS